MDIPFVFRDDILKGQVAFITGGASGIGRATATRLAMAGANIVIASRRLELCEEVAAEIAQKHNVKTCGLLLNVRDSDAVVECFAKAHREMGRLDILLNNAAGNFYHPSHMLSDNQWRAVLEIDLYGTFHCCRAAYPYMKENGGVITSITMTLHHAGWPGMLPACAAKSGIEALTRTLAIEWSRHRIRVNAIAPGPIATEGVRKAFSAGGDIKDIGERIPLGRTGEPEEVGDIAVFLASPAATWITGEIITVDGGERLSPNRGSIDPEALEQFSTMLREQKHA